MGHFNRISKKVAARSTIFTSTLAKLRYLHLLYHSDGAMAKPNKKGGKPQKGQKRGPSFNEDALAQLTSKIDQNLNGNDHKRKKPPTTDSGAQDRKRQRNSSNGPSKPTPKSEKSEKETLLEEIRALGGDEEDLKLIEDIDSSDEEFVKDDKKPVDKSLKDELAAFSKQLGFSNYQPSEASEEEQEENDEDFEDVEDDEDEDEDEEQEEQGEQDEEDADDNDELDAPRKVGNLVSCP